MPPKKKAKPQKRTNRKYSPDDLTTAYIQCKDNKMPATKAARIYNVPRTTLRDRLSGRIDPETVTSGKAPLFSMVEEAKLCEHFKIMANYGYVYTRMQSVDVASDFAVQLGKRSKNKPLSTKWIRGFLKRWPEMRGLKPKDFKYAGATMASESIVSEYFRSLNIAIEILGLSEKPHFIFSLDEKVITTDHNGPCVEGRGNTVTMIGCASAIGVTLPPFFVFSGQKMYPDLLKGKSPGAGGAVSESGWPTQAIFREYLESHFLKYIPGGDGQKVLLILDGDKSHISVGLSEWIEEMGIILFIMPPHTSHLLQPMEVSCFEPFERIYEVECQKLRRQTQAKITRYNICEMACQAYAKALSIDNVLFGFESTGIYPFNPEVIPKEYLLPAEPEVYVDKDEVSDETNHDSQDTVVDGVNDVSESEVEDGGPTAASSKKGKKSKAADGDGPPAKKSKADKAEAKSKLRKEASLTDGMDFSHDCQTKDGRKPNWKIASWNINGIRAWMDKGGLSYLKDESPDILCVQETKCAEADLPDDVKVDGYHDYWSSAEQAGYAGTGIYSKTEPINVTYGLGIEKHDSEGRVITAEYDQFYLVTAYVPNSGRGLPRLPYRTKEWDVDFRNHLNDLNNKKPVIMCGDLNVAHLEIDLANPKTNKKTAGFTPQERQGFTDLLAEGYIDSYRELYPETEGAYSFWTYMGNARGKNVGWRLDYFVLSEKLKEDLCDNVIRKDVMGSDHCPVVLFMAIK